MKTIEKMGIGLSFLSSHDQRPSTAAQSFHRKFSNFASAVHNLHWTKYIYIRHKIQGITKVWWLYGMYFCVYIKTKYPDQQNLELLSKIYQIRYSEQFCGITVGSLINSFSECILISL